MDIPTLFYIFVGVLLASTLAILLMLALVFLCESTADWSGFGQMLAGFVFVLFGVRGLWWAWFAIPHHRIWYPRYPHWQAAAWMNPWQAAAAFALCFVLGLVLLINAVHARIRKT